jgi:NAD(P)-dependent dehydrogenase (short-subunit alcohol dehydrogenase family)
VARLPTVDLDAALIDNLLAVNIRAPLLLIAAFVPSMVERGGGSIINLSSVLGLVGTPRRAAYAASKGALDAMTRPLAMELGPSGIRVNSVAPGVVDTGLWAKTKAIPGLSRRSKARPLFAGGPRPRTSPTSSSSCRYPRPGSLLARPSPSTGEWGEPSTYMPARSDRRRLRRSGSGCTGGGLELVA